MQAILLQKTNTTPEVYTFDVTGMTTKTLMALSRHQSFSLTSQSSRYTMRKMNTKTDGPEDTVTFTGVGKIDVMMIKHMEEIRELTEDKSLKQDDLCMLLPQAYLYNVVMTVDENGLDHFIGLRNEDSHAHKDIKRLAKCLRDAKGSEPTFDYKNGISDIYVCSTAIRKCYSTTPSDSKDKELDLVRRIGISNKHMSVLRHLLLVVDKHYATKYSVNVGKKEVINLQSLLETNNYRTLPPIGPLEPLAAEYYKGKNSLEDVVHPDRLYQYTDVPRECFLDKMVSTIKELFRS